MTHSDPPRYDAAIAALIDHTILKPEATRADVERTCREARTYHFASVCVNSFWVPVASQQLLGSKVNVCATVGFPLGAAATEAKVAETAIAIRTGAREADMVLNVGALRSGDEEAVFDDICAVVQCAHESGVLLKVILETVFLTDEQKQTACSLAVRAGVDFVKTSTGFAGGGATLHDVALMRAAVGPAIGVKAAGGIRTLEEVKAMLAAGATRIGTSSGVQIVEAAAH
jgi:deoxyribose-phosphate aldolase